MSLVTRSRKALTTALALSFVAVIATAAPTMAASPSHGVSATCRYKTVNLNGGTGFELNRIVVQPPTTLFGHFPNQTVGYRVIVQRSYPNNDGPTPHDKWVGVFKGKIQTSVASPGQAGVFTPIRAGIDYVAGVDLYPYGYRSWFRTIVKFYRFDADGSVESHGRHKVPHFQAYRDGNPIHIQYGICDGAWVDPLSGPPQPL